MLQVIIAQKGTDSQLEEHLSIRPTKLRPAATRKGLKSLLISANIFIFLFCLSRIYSDI